MTKNYATIITNFNTAANEKYAELELFKATPLQEKLFTMVHNSIFTLFGSAGAIINSDEYTEAEKVDICTHLCNQIVSIELNRTAIRDALSAMEASLKYPRIKTGKPMGRAIQDYRNFEE